MLIVRHSYSGDTIEIHVEDTKFFIPKSIICRTSEFFKNTAKPEWEGEDGPRPVMLDEEDTARIFKLYTVWLYNGSISRADDSLKTWEPLSLAYVMGEKFLDVSFQAVILKYMFRRLIETGRRPSIETVNAIYCGTSDPSPARCFMIDICVWVNRGCLGDIENPAVELHEDLVRDLLRALTAMPKPEETDSPWELDSGTYFKQLIRGGLLR